jgi:D-threonate/D-erythronate kinase
MAVTVIADDLTGACDTGALFAGRHTVAVFVEPALPGPDWLAAVVDTESRGLAPDEASRRIRRTAAGLTRRLAKGTVFKKIDSTFRGPIAAELDALLDAVGAPAALVCPAFPAQRRTVLHGVLLVDGAPAHETPVGLDPDYPGATSDLLDVLARGLGYGTAHRVSALPLKEVRGAAGDLARDMGARRGLIVADAETDADLEALAAAALATRSLVLAGSAGLAGAVAVALGFAPPSITCPAPGAWLIVAGSLHPATRAQIAALTAAGVAGVRLPRSGEADLAPVMAALHQGRPAFIAIHEGLDPSRERVAATLADLARRALAARPTMVAVTGGQTAHALMRACGAAHLELVGAPAPGLALGRLVASDGGTLPLLTKAGGFGPPDLYLTLARGAA